MQHFLSSLLKSSRETLWEALLQFEELSYLSKVIQRVKGKAEI